MKVIKGCMTLGEGGVGKLRVLKLHATAVGKDDKRVHTLLWEGGVGKLKGAEAIRNSCRK